MKLEKKLVFIFNPKAGKGKIKTSLMDIVDIFNKGGYEVIIRATQAPKDAYEQVKKYADKTRTSSSAAAVTARWMKWLQALPRWEARFRSDTYRQEAPMTLPTAFSCRRICWMRHL